jgi:hypothetical protein
MLTNIIERGEIAKTLQDETQMQKIKALVFIDDFIGTGGSACQYFEELANECGELLRNPNLIVFFISVSGFQEAKTRLEAKLVELNVMSRCIYAILLMSQLKFLAIDLKYSLTIVI